MADNRTSTTTTTTARRGPGMGGGRGRGGRMIIAKPKDFRGTFRKLLRFMRPHWMGMTAIICSHDLLANAAMIQCQQFGIRIPDDLSIIGFDDLPISSTLHPLLTTIRQDRLELGRTGYFSLNSMLHGVALSRTLLHPELVVRASTAKRTK